MPGRVRAWQEQDLLVCQEVAIFAYDNEQAEMNAEFIHVIAAEYISGYLLKLTFSNGDVRLFDFSQLYNKGIFVKLQNPEYFKNYTLDGWTVDWNNEIGFAPEYLHEHGVPAA